MTEDEFEAIKTQANAALAKGNYQQAFQIMSGVVEPGDLRGQPEALDALRVVMLSPSVDSVRAFVERLKN